MFNRSTDTPISNLPAKLVGGSKQRSIGRGRGHERVLAVALHICQAVKSRDIPLPAILRFMDEDGASTSAIMLPSTEYNQSSNYFRDNKDKILESRQVIPSPMSEHYPAEDRPSRLSTAKDLVFAAQLRSLPKSTPRSLSSITSSLSDVGSINPTSLPFQNFVNITQDLESRLHAEERPSVHKVLKTLEDPMQSSSLQKTMGEKLGITHVISLDHSRSLQFTGKSPKHEFGALTTVQQGKVAEASEVRSAPSSSHLSSMLPLSVNERGDAWSPTLTMPSMFDESRRAFLLPTPSFVPHVSDHPVIRSRPAGSPRTARLESRHEQVILDDPARLPPTTATSSPDTRARDTEPSASGRTVNLVGSIMMDGRRLGQLTASAQAREASLPARGPSRVNRRVIPVYSGMQIPS